METVFYKEIQVTNHILLSLLWFFSFSSLISVSSWLKGTPNELTLNIILELELTKKLPNLVSLCKNFLSALW